MITFLICEAPFCVTWRHNITFFLQNKWRSRSRSSQGQRSRSVQINIITKIPYYPLLLCEISDFRKVYWSQRCLCLPVCLSSKAPQSAPLIRSSWFFLQKMSSGHATMQNSFFWKSDEGQGQGHHFCENQIMGHNFWTGSDRNFGLVAKRSLSNSASVRYPPFWSTTSRFYITWL